MFDFRALLQQALSSGYLIDVVVKMLAALTLTTTLVACAAACRIQRRPPRRQLFAKRRRGRRRPAPSFSAANTAATAPTTTCCITTSTSALDPDKKFLSGKTTIRFRMLSDDNRIQIDLHQALNVDRILLAGAPLKYTREERAVFIDFPQQLRRGPRIQ